MGLFVCEDCGKMFTENTFLEKHKKTKCRGKTTAFKCSICLKVFASKSFLHKHYSTHISAAKSGEKNNAKAEKVNNASGRWSCSQCEQTFAKECSLQRHLGVHRKSKSMEKTDSNFTCIECYKTFKTKVFLTEHYKRNHSKTTKSKVEKGSLLKNKKTPVPSKVDNVNTSSGNVVGFITKIPEASVGNSGNGSAKQKFTLQVKLADGSSFNLTKEQENLVKNAASAGNSDEELFSEQPLEEDGGNVSAHDSDCIDGSDEKAAMKKIEAFLGGLDKKPERKEQQFLPYRPFICEVCGISFAMEYFLEDHMKKHRDEKAYSCLVCGSSFNCQKDLTQHRRTHPGVKPYACSVCHKEFGNNGVLRRHMRIHTQEKPYFCKVCDRGFTDLAGLRAHEYSHTDERPFECSICGLKFKSQKTMQLHIQNTHEKKNVFQCNMCDSKFNYKSSLQEHLRRHTKTFSFFCQECDEGFVTKSALQRHLPQHKDIRFKCEICDKDYGRPYDLKIHQRTHTGERPHACKMCDMTFYTKHNLNRHQQLHLAKDDLNSEMDLDEDGEGCARDGDSASFFSCGECGKVFVKRHNYDKHMRMEHATGKVECPVCQEQCSGSEQLKTHISEHHFVTCKFCKMNIADDKQLRDHIAKKHPEKNLECQYCGEKFGQPSQLKNHIVKHKEARIHKCDRCDAAFSRVLALHKHMLCHPDVQSHQCPHCDMRYYMREALEKHIAKKHEMNRPIKCPICPQRFKNTSIMYIHKQTHNNADSKPFKCNICVVGFSADVFLQRHNKRFHSDPGTNEADETSSYTLGPQNQDAEDINNVNNVTNDQVATQPSNTHGESEAYVPESVEVITEFVGFDPSDNDVTYLVLEGSEEGVEFPQDGSATNPSSVDVVTEQIQMQTGVLETGTSGQALSEAGANTNGVQIITEQSYLHNDPVHRVLYVNPTEVILGAQVEMVLEMKDSDNAQADIEVSSEIVDDVQSGNQTDYVLEKQGPIAEASESIERDPSDPQLDQSQLVSVIRQLPSGEIRQELVGNKRRLLDCRICGSRYLSKRQLTRHFKQSHPGEAYWWCAPCERSFSSYSTFREHCHVHEGQRQVCHVCGAVAKSKQRLRSHLMTHLPSQPHLCDVCGKGFRHKQSMLRHKVTHDGEKQLECELCQKRFFHQSQLNEHLARHLSDRPHKCDQCDKSFVNPSNLRRHCKTHERVKKPRGRPKRVKVGPQMDMTEGLPDIEGTASSSVEVEQGEGLINYEDIQLVVGETVILDGHFTTIDMKQTD